MIGALSDGSGKQNSLESPDNFYYYIFLFTLQTGTCQPPRTWHTGGHYKHSSPQHCHYTYYEWDCKTERVKDCSIEIAIDTCTTKSAFKIPTQKFIDTDKNCEDSSREDCIHVPYNECEELPFVGKLISQKIYISDYSTSVYATHGISS